MARNRQFRQGYGQFAAVIVVLSNTIGPVRALAMIVALLTLGVLAFARFVSPRRKAA